MAISADLPRWHCSEEYRKGKESMHRSAQSAIESVLPTKDFGKAPIEKIASQVFD